MKQKKVRYTYPRRSQKPSSFVMGLTKPAKMSHRRQTSTRWNRRGGGGGGKDDRSPTKTVHLDLLRPLPTGRRRRKASFSRVQSQRHLARSDDGVIVVGTLIVNEYGLGRMNHSFSRFFFPVCYNFFVAKSLRLFRPSLVGGRQFETFLKTTQQ